MKEIKKYKGISLKYNENNGKICFDFEGQEREVKYVFEAESIIDEPVWKSCELKGYFVDGYIYKYIGLAKATRKNIKTGKPDWKFKGQYDVEFKRPNSWINIKVYPRNENNDKVYKEWEKQTLVYEEELIKLNSISEKLKIIYVGKIKIAVLIGLVSLLLIVNKPVVADNFGKDKPMQDPQDGYLLQYNICTHNDIVCGNWKPKKYETIKNAKITMYNPLASQTDNTPCITANGYNICTAELDDTAANNCLPFGTVIVIDKLGSFIIRDRMNKRYNCQNFDVVSQSYEEAINFGRQNYEVKIIK